MEARDMRFVWGSHDCVLFAAKMADAISDARHAERAKLAFQWSSAREAAAIVGNADLRELVEVVMGPMLRWQSLSIGDIVLIKDDDGMYSLAIHDGVQIIGPDAVGYKNIPFSYAQGGWKVT